MSNELTYLLTSDGRGYDAVAIYTAAEMIELFTATERAALADGSTILRKGYTWADMRVAARAAMQAAA